MVHHYKWVIFKYIKNADSSSFKIKKESIVQQNISVDGFDL